MIEAIVAVALALHGGAAGAPSDTTLVVPPGTRVEVIAPHGAVVRGVEGDEVAIDTGGSAGVAMELRGSVLRIEVDPDRVRGALRMEIPRSSPISAVSGEGDVDVRGLEARVEVDTGWGSIRVSDISGRVDVVSDSGRVTVEDVSGSVSARAYSREMRLSRIRGDVEAVNVTSYIHLVDVTADVIQASNVTGETHFTGPLSAGGTYRFTSHMGQIVLTLPRDASAAIRGEVNPDAFQLRGFRSEVDRDASNQTVLVQLGGGSADVRISSFSGGVTVASGSPGGEDRR